MSLDLPQPSGKTPLENPFRSRMPSPEVGSKLLRSTTDESTWPKVPSPLPSNPTGSKTTASKQQGLANSPAPNATSSSIWHSSGRFRHRRNGDCRRNHAYFDLLRLRFLALRDVQRQRAILIVGLDLLRVHGVRQREAPGERAIRAFDAQVVFLFRLLLKLDVRRES